MTANIKTLEQYTALRSHWIVKAEALGLFDSQDMKPDYEGHRCTKFT
jgi:hypothetical protein